MRTKRFGTILLISGLLLLAAALALIIYNKFEDEKAGQMAEHALDQINEGISKKTTDDSSSDFLPDYVLDPDMDMPIISVDGNEYVGVLRIPSIELELPVHSSWNYYNLKTAPCRYEGSAYKDDFILAAHNYSSHFGHIRELQIGDIVQFTDTVGNVFVYEVVEMETLGPKDVEEMSAGDWDMTLFTCTPGGRTRVTIRCERVAEQE